MYQVTCKSIGSRPAAKIVWYKDSQRLNSISDNVLEDGLVTISKIEFVPSLEDNSKQIVCKAVNQEFSNFFIEDRYHLNINCKYYNVTNRLTGSILIIIIIQVFYYYNCHIVAPILSLALGANTKSEDIRKGSDVTFECNIQVNIKNCNVK